jgi:hypothetical protein
MAEAIHAEERLRRLRRDQARARRARLARQLAAPLWAQVRGVVPVVFELSGVLDVRAMSAPPEAVIAALRTDGVLALDAAMRRHVGSGCVPGGDVHVYLTDPAVLERLATRGLVGHAPCADRVWMRAWQGPPRLFAALVAELPPHETLADGTRVVTRAHLIRELLGALGPRLDILAPLLVDGCAESDVPG